MINGPAPSLCFIEKSYIRMSTQNDVACLVGNAAMWIGSNIIKQEVDGLFCGNSGLGLTGFNSTESNKKFFVYSASVVEERPHNLLDAVLGGIVKKF